MAHRLDPVAVEIAHERRVVAGPVGRPLAGSALVDRAVPERDRVERSHRRAVLRAEGHVATLPARPGLLAGREDGEHLVLRAGRAVAEGARVGEDAHVTEGGEHGVVEGAGAGEVGDAEGEVVDHGAFFGAVDLVRKRDAARVFPAGGGTMEARVEHPRPNILPSQDRGLVKRATAPLAVTFAFLAACSGGQAGTPPPGDAGADHSVADAALRDASDGGASATDGGDGGPDGGAGGLLPTDRATVWQPGVTYNGGIPARTTLCATLTASGDTTGNTDTTAIQNALNACPAGQTVQLAGGNFYIVGQGLTFHSNTTLRGSGPGVTTLNAVGTTAPIVVGAQYILYQNQIDLTTDAVQGATSVTTATAGGLSVGQLVAIDEQYDPALTWYDPGSGGGTQKDDYHYCGRSLLGRSVPTRRPGRCPPATAVAEACRTSRQPMGEYAGDGQPGGREGVGEVALRPRVRAHKLDRSVRSRGGNAARVPRR